MENAHTKLKVFSLFTGVGGFELGLKSALGEDGFETVGMSEIDKHAVAVLRHRFPLTKQYGDITKIDWSLVPDFDLLVGGSPCQDLSIAGKRAGLEGGRSGLFYEYVRALEAKKPAFFIWENVKGALSSNGGRDFGAVLSALAEAGYSLWWQVLNAKDFGVPQNRERIFVVGTRNGSPREVFFERGDDGETAVHALTPPGTSDAFRVYGTDGVNKTLAANGGGTGAKTGLIVNRGEAKQTDQANAIDANFHKGLDNHGQRTGVLSIQRCGDRDKNTVSTMEVAHTLAANPMSDYLPKVTDLARIRRLTPKECERLMSWPDSWTKYGNYDGVIKELADGNRYKCCGNGVVSNVVAEIVKAHLL